MGGAASKQKDGEKVDKSKLVNIVDYVARNFILTSNFKDIDNLAKGLIIATRLFYLQQKLSQIR